MQKDKTTSEKWPEKLITFSFTLCTDRKRNWYVQKVKNKTTLLQQEQQLQQQLFSRFSSRWNYNIFQFFVEWKWFQEPFSFVLIIIFFHRFSPCSSNHFRNEKCCNVCDWHRLTFNINKFGCKETPKVSTLMRNTVKRKLEMELERPPSK